MSPVRCGTRPCSDSGCHQIRTAARRHRRLLLGGPRVDPDSGNASQSAFCLVLGGAFGFFCPRTSPAITGQQAQARPCTTIGTAYPLEIPGENGIDYTVVAHGPEGGTDCHVNLVLYDSNHKEISGYNYHIYYTQYEYYDARVNFISVFKSNDEEVIAGTLIGRVAARIGGAQGALVSASVGLYNNLVAQLAVLQGYPTQPPAGP